MARPQSCSRRANPNPKPNPNPGEHTHDPKAARGVLTLTLTLTQVSAHTTPKLLAACVPVVRSLHATRRVHVAHPGISFTKEERWTYPDCAHVCSPSGPEELRTALVYNMITTGALLNATARRRTSAACQATRHMQAHSEVLATVAAQISHAARVHPPPGGMSSVQRPPRSHSDPTATHAVGHPSATQQL